jgi:hypothetical protein
MSKEIPAHVQRMQEELFDLEERTEKLIAFIGVSPIFSTLEPAETTDLVEQWLHMYEYRKILRRRVNRAEQWYTTKQPIQTTMAEPCDTCGKLDANQCERCNPQQIPHSQTCLTAGGGPSDDDCICGAHEANAKAKANQIDLDGKDVVVDPAAAWPFPTGNRGYLKQ